MCRDFFWKKNKTFFTYTVSHKKRSQLIVVALCNRADHYILPYISFFFLGHPCKFQRLSRLGSVTARHSSTGRQPNFAA